MSPTITVFIANLAVRLPRRYTTLTAEACDILNDIHCKRIKAKLRYMLDRGELAPQDAQAKADELVAAGLSLAPTPDDDDSGPDAIQAEALAIARDLIVSRMAKENLQPPKGLDLHAKALVDAMPEIQEQARLRLQARFAAANAAIGQLT
jgi:hypothetical protein